MQNEFNPEFNSFEKAPDAQWWEPEAPSPIQSEIVETPIAAESVFTPPAGQEEWWNNENSGHDTSDALAEKLNPFSEVVAENQKLYEQLDIKGTATIPMTNLLRLPGSNQPQTVERDVSYDELSDRLGGWKLHLNIDEEDTASVEKTQSLLGAMRDAGQISNFKIGFAGDQVGKSTTVYVGHHDKAVLSAGIIDNLLGNTLKAPEGDTLEDDTPFTNRVMARFDVGNKIDERFHQYGSNGVPSLLEDVRSRAFGTPVGANAAGNAVGGGRLRAINALVKTYGAFFTGNDVANR